MTESVNSARDGTPAPRGRSGDGGIKSAGSPSGTPTRFTILATADVPLRCMPSTKTPALAEDMSPAEDRCLPRWNQPPPAAISLQLRGFRR